MARATAGFVFLLALIFADFLSAKSLSAKHLKAQVLYAFSTYCPKEHLSSWNCYWCQQDQSHLTVVTTISNKKDDSFAYVGFTDSYIQIAIRGTIVSSITGWLRDFEFITVNYGRTEDNIQVHSGFFKVYKGLKADLLAAFKQATMLCPKCPQVRVTGHSLGGAVATIAAMEIQNVTALPVSLTTFGSPRVGNLAFAELVVANVDESVRVVHESDIVTRVPPAMMGYHHVSSEVWQHKGEFRQCDRSGEDPNCSDSVLLPNFQDHISYVDLNLWDGLPNCAGVYESNIARLYQMIRQ